MTDQTKEPAAAKRPRGRPKKYKTDGAPQVTIRLDPDVHEWLKVQPGGMRATVQRMARAEMKTPKETQR
jgi:uncharacterized protein (DUF4415 family)